MAIRLDTRSADFAQKFRAFLDGKRETSADVEAVVHAIVADVAARGDTALKEYTQKFDRLDLDRVGIKVTPEEIAAALGDCARGRARRAETRPRPHRGFSSPADAAGRPLHRCARRRARVALDGDRRGRPLRARRHRRLSVLGADECGAGKGRRRAADRHGGAGARRQAQSAGAGGGEARRCRRDLSHRRRAGGRGARLRHRVDCAGRQDRRAGQRLCGCGEAHGVRQGRHRHDRRPLRGADHRRRRPAIRTGSPPIFWPRPSTTPARKPS